MEGLGRGPTKTRLSYPKGMWIRKDNRILVADYSNHRILERGTDKKKKKVAGTGVFGHRWNQLTFPTDVIFQESTNSFLICDYRNHRVSRWSPGQKICDEILIDEIACHGIAIDSDDNIYVSNTENHEVRRYAPGDPRGVIVAGGHGRGSRLHQLNGPTFICIGPENALYISDPDNNRVVRWDSNANNGVVVTGGIRKGNLYVVDGYNHRVQRFKILPAPSTE